MRPRGENVLQGLTTKVQRLALCDIANFSVDPIPSRYEASIPSFNNNIYLFIYYSFIY